MNRNNIRQPDNAPCPAPNLSSLQIITKQPVSPMGQQAQAVALLAEWADLAVQNQRGGPHD